MPSPSRCCATWVSILPSLLLLPFFLSFVFGVQGATLREHRLSGSEPASYGPMSQLHPSPSAEMLRALRYIQSLSQRTPPKPLTDDQQPTTADHESDEMESIRSMLQLASPVRSSTGKDRGMEEIEEDKKKDNTQEWLQAVLRALQETEEQSPQKSSQKVITHASSLSRPRYAIHSLPRPKQQLEVDTSVENYGRNSWANPGSWRPHRQYPHMFEDEGQEQPLKRTNENAEEQYTPQKLATLQSVFEELSGMSASKAASKANSKQESAVANTADDDEEDDDDLYRQRKMVLEDFMGTDEWTPLEEQIETEEESERHGFTRNLEDDVQEEEEEEDDDVKRSNQSDWFQTEKEDPEDIAKLVDYYLLKVLEKKEQEEQKREEANKREQQEESDREVEKKDADEEVERDEEERDSNPMHGTVPQSLSQLIKISQKLQITPEEVLDLFQNEKPKDFFRIPLESRTPPRPYTTTHDDTIAAAPQRRPLKTSESNSVTQDILKILELASAALQNDKLHQRPTQPKTLHYYEKERDLPEYVFPETSRDDYDDTVSEEDELANYLASDMFAQGPRHERLMPSNDEEGSMYGKLERAVQDYFDKSVPEKIPLEHEGAATGINDDTMLKILRYLDPESDNASKTDSEGETVPKM
ncbi:secretogranin-2-like [Myxocyprinus asiaticus]|uniref:secretogranin-2-like n=1 Tax=Myxocyprinus asiaticus TaxID=70543 RepID=UPI002223641F|nr:secretogranin-2-like [Myxocyprinus asiaticus]